MARDYYDVLGVAKDATDSEIKLAYRKRAREYHPDVSNACDATARFTELNEAYVTLRSEKSRGRYDDLLLTKMCEENIILPPGRILMKRKLPIQKPSKMDNMREVVMWCIVTFQIMLYLSTFIHVS